MGKIIGWTGGIGTGKSTAAEILQEVAKRKKIKLLLVDGDLVARYVVKPGRWGWKRLKSVFGTSHPHVFKEDGSLDRPALGSLVFGNDELRAKLNWATHLPIYVRMLWLVFWGWAFGKDLVVIDAPLFYETGVLTRLVNHAVVVACSPEQQLKRLMSRNNYSEEEAMSRIKAQLPIGEKITLADSVIDNENSLEETKTQIDAWLDRSLPTVAPPLWPWVLIIVLALPFLVLAAIISLLL